MKYTRFIFALGVLGLLVYLAVEYRARHAFSDDWVPSSHRCYCNEDCLRPSTLKLGAWVQVPSVRTTCEGGYAEDVGWYTVCPAGVNVGARATNCDDTWGVCISCNERGGALCPRD